MISVAFNVTEDDVLALTRFYCGVSPVIRKTRFRLQVTIPLMLAAIGLVMFFGSGFLAAGGGGWLRPVGVGLVVFAVLIALGIPWFYQWAIRRAAERTFSDPSYRKVFGRYTLVVSDEGLVSTSPLGEARYAWEVVDRIALTPAHLFILLVGAHGFAIPRSQLPDSTVQELKAFVESRARRSEPATAARP